MFRAKNQMFEWHCVLCSRLHCPCLALPCFALLCSAQLCTWCYFGFCVCIKSAGRLRCSYSHNHNSSVETHNARTNEFNVNTNIWKAYAAFRFAKNSTFSRLFDTHLIPSERNGTERNGIEWTEWNGRDRLDCDAFYAMLVLAQLSILFMTGILIRCHKNDERFQLVKYLELKI